MDFDKLSKKERYDAMTEMADMYYNQGKTQVEIADYFDTTRFKIAKLLQDARNEQIVEIKINFSNERNKSIEQELLDAFPLKKAIVVNTQYTPYLDSLRQVGQVGSAYLSKLLLPQSVLGIAWGKTIQTVIGQLPQKAHNPIYTVQLAGYIPLSNPAADSRELVRHAASSYFGSIHYFNTPLYINNPDLKSGILAEPDLYNTLCKAKELSVVLTGIGGRSSLPLTNPVFRPYLTQRDIDATENCCGSIFGYVLDKSGQIADIDLNKKLMAVPIDDILRTPHRIAVMSGRHKVDITALAIKNQFINEIITDTDTALNLLEHL